LQTPLNEEKGGKRDREEDTLISGPAKQPEAKRQRVAPLPEEEVIEEIIEIPRSERAASPLTSLVTESPTSFYGQQFGKLPIMEISSARPQSKQSSDIKRPFMEIKAQNEPIRM